jgi:hypothetical protein
MFPPFRKDRPKIGDADRPLVRGGAIIEPSMWEPIQDELRARRPGASSTVDNLPNALLHRLLFCHLCDRPMAHTYTAAHGRRYRYYICRRACQRERSKRAYVSHDTERSTNDWSIWDNPAADAASFPARWRFRIGCLNLSFNAALTREVLVLHQVAGFSVRLGSSWHRECTFAVRVEN